MHVRTGATSFDDSFGGSGRELLNTEKNIFNSGSETEGIAEISCDTIAVVAVSSSTPPPNHVVFNLGAAQCPFCAPMNATRYCSVLRDSLLYCRAFWFVCLLLGLTFSFVFVHLTSQAALADMVGPIPTVRLFC